MSASSTSFQLSPATDLLRLPNPNASSGFSKSSTSSTTFTSSPAIPKPTLLPPKSSNSTNAENAPFLRRQPVILSLRQVSIPNFLEGLYLPLPHIEYHVDFFQSSAIIYYLLNTYDTNNKFSPEDPLKDEILTSFAGATLGPLITLELVLDLVVKHTPWPFVYFSRFLRKKMQNKFTRKELTNALSWLWQQRNGAYYNGSEIGRSDVMLSWPLDLIAARNWYVLTSVLVWV